MFNTLPDLLRKKSIESIFSTQTFTRCWPIWKQEIHSILGENYNENDIIDLGDQLSRIFQSTGGNGRGQGELSGGGVAWESLVCWYINLCTAGSRIVALRKMSLVPEPIKDAITVNYGNFACNTESDITVIIFPDTNDYNHAISDLNIVDDEQILLPLINNKINYQLLNFLSVRDFDQLEIGVIQCKTNWNDNAQIPMLWDMIYSANGFRGRNITIGRNGFNIHSNAGFTYSFVTVPSNQRAVYGPNNVSVKRVTNLSGGNYWGKPTEANVARSIKEIFNNNYYNGFRSNIRTDIREAIPYFGSNLNYFDII